MNHLELLATILKRIAAYRDAPNAVKAGVFAGFVQLIDESDLEFPAKGWPLCRECERGADLIDRENEDPWCDACWHKLSAEEQCPVVRLADLLEKV